MEFDYLIGCGGMKVLYRITRGIKDLWLPSDDADFFAHPSTNSYLLTSEAPVSSSLQSAGILSALISLHLNSGGALSA